MKWEYISESAIDLDVDSCILFQYTIEIYFDLIFDTESMFNFKVTTKYGIILSELKCDR